MAHIGEVFLGFLKGGVDGECSPLADLPVVLPPDVHHQVLVEEDERPDHKEHPQLTKQTHNEEDLRENQSARFINQLIITM